MGKRRRATGGKTQQARQRLTAGNFLLPSPCQIEAAKTWAGGWTAATLAGWGVKWEWTLSGTRPHRRRRSTIYAAAVKPTR